MTFNEWKASLVEGKNPCYRCRQNGGDSEGDHFTYYGEGKGGYCFNPSCNFTIPSEDYLEELEANKEPQEYFYEMSKDFNEAVHEEIKRNTGVDSKGYRGIRADISRSLGVRYEYSEEDGSVVKSYYPVTENCLELGIPESLVGYKVRTHPKNFYSIGKVGKNSDLFAQWKFPTHNNILVICAGEIDQMSAYQMLLDAHNKRDKEGKWDEIAVVSSTNGEGGTAAQVRRQYQWVSQFSKVIVCLDNDEAGRKATEEVVKVLPRGKAFVMNLRYKDVNEYLVQGKEQEFIRDFWGHRPYVMDGVKSSFDGFLEIEEEILKPKISLPPYMHRLQYNMGGGISQGAITNIIAATGVSKTTHLRNIVYHIIMNTDLKPTIISLEETAAKYNLELLQLHAQENFTFGKSGQEVLEYINTPRMLQLRKELIENERGEPRYYIIDERSGNIKEIEKQMELMYKKHGSSVYVLDVLNDLLRGSSEEYSEDHMAFQRRFVKEGVTIINAMHTRKPPVGKDGKEARTTEYDVLGTGSFVQSAHTNIVLNRDKTSDSDIVRNTTEVDMPKCRGGITGEAGRWYWDFNTLQCYDLDDYMVENPHLFVGEQD